MGSSTLLTRCPRTLRKSIMKQKLPRTSSSMLFAITVLCVFALSACRQDPGGANQNVSNIVTSPAHPALTYYGLVKRGDSSYPAIYVMDAEGKYQQPIYTGDFSTTILESSPSWSPDGKSIAFTQGDSTTGEYAIRAMDVPSSISTQGATNIRTVISYSDPSYTLHNPFWSSTGAMAKIAYTMVHTTPRGEILYSLCVVPVSGGQRTMVWTGFRLPGGIGYCAWSPDDSRLAVWRGDAVYGGTIMIFNTSDWSYVDSIAVTGSLAGLEWSRAGLNKLAFGIQTNGASSTYLYYCDPKTGATPITDGVIGYFPVWSSNNSSILYCSSNGLSKITPFTLSTSLISPAITTLVKWKR